jgi:hypothetical protein
MERIEMSQEERDKLEWLKKSQGRGDHSAQSGGTDWRERTVGAQAAEADQEARRCGGRAWARGRASNRKIATQIQKRAIKVLKQADWHDFGLCGDG